MNSYHTKSNYWYRGTTFTSAFLSSQRQWMSFCGMSCPSTSSTTNFWAVSFSLLLIFSSWISFLLFFCVFELKWLLCDLNLMWFYFCYSWWISNKMALPFYSSSRFTFTTTRNSLLDYFIHHLPPPYFSSPPLLLADYLDVNDLQSSWIPFFSFLLLLFSFFISFYCDLIVICFVFVVRWFDIISQQTSIWIWGSMITYGFV